MPKIRIAGGYTWSFDKNKEGLIFKGYLYYKDLFALENKISKHPFPGKEQFDIEDVKRTRAKVKRKLQLMFKYPRSGYLPKVRQSYIDCLGNKVYSCAFGSKTERKAALMELEFITEMLDEKLSLPLYFGDIAKSIGLINLAKQIYKQTLYIEAGSRVYGKAELEFNSQILREKLMIPPFANYPLSKTELLELQEKEGLSTQRR